MGYSSRYHAASLAAVFIALAVGILIGAALGSDVISGTAENLEQDLEEDLDQVRAENAELEEQLAAERALGERLFPAVVGGRLARERVAVIGLGDTDPALAEDVRSAVEQAGAELTEVATVREPPDTGAVVSALRDDSRGAVPRGRALALAARRGGHLLVGRGGRFADARDALLSRFSGTPPRRVDAAIVMRSRPGDLAGRADADTDTLEDALVAGLTSTGVPVVGVEGSDTDPSSISFFADRGLSSVDNVDTLAGKIALVLALDGAEGSFGVKESADSLLPELIVPGPAAG